MVHGLIGNQGREASPNGNSHPNGNTLNDNNNGTYIDYLAEARKNLGLVDEFSDEQAYQMGMLNALIGIGYELRKLNKHNRINQQNSLGLEKQSILPNGLYCDIYFP